VSRAHLAYLHAIFPTRYSELVKYVVSTASGNLNLRSGPGTGYRIIGSLKKGEVVEIDSIQSKWAKLKGRTAYAHADFLRPAARQTTPSFRTLPDGQTMWLKYPGTEEDADAVKRRIGGGVNASHIKNTCVIRLSAALNAAGHPVPSALPGLATVVGGDGRRYALRVREIRKYLEDTYGPPTYVLAGPGAKAALSGKRGIILFEVAGFSDATGHVDMWNGRTVRYQEFFSQAQEVLLWAY
jgi:hypothetical protein